jgi:hypothetical protein
MKKLFTILSACMLMACSDPLELTQRANGVPDASGVSTQGLGPIPAPAYIWTSMPLPVLPGPYPTNNNSERMKTIFVNGNAYWFIGELVEYPYKLNHSTQRWEKFTGPEHVHNPFIGGYKYLFSRGTKYYTGFRLDDGEIFTDQRAIYSQDVVTGDTERLPDFPGTLTEESVFIVAGSRFYIMGGRKGNLISNQYWEFDFNTNQWTNKGGLPGGARSSFVAYVIDNTVYFGLGYDLITYNGQTSKRYKRDWYAMTAGGTVAAVKAGYTGEDRWQADGFVIKNKIYIGWGRSRGGESSSDFWQYNPSNNTWTQKLNCPAAHSGLDNMDVFAIGDTGYFIRGLLGQFYRYSDSPFILQ